MTNIFHSTLVIAHREFLRFFQQRSRLLASIGVPLLFLLLLGSGLRLAAEQLEQGDGFLLFVFPAFIVITVVTSSLFTGLSVVWDREFGFMRVVLVAPLSRTGIVLGKVIGGATIAVIQGSAIAFLAPIIGIHLGIEAIIGIVPILLLLSLSLAALGVAVGVHLQSQQGYLVVVQLLMLVLIFFSGTFVPLESMPEWMSWGAAINPVHYGVDAMRQFYVTDPAQVAPFVFEPAADTRIEAGLITLAGVIFTVIAVWEFNHES